MPPILWSAQVPPGANPDPQQQDAAPPVLHSALCLPFFLQTYRWPDCLVFVLSDQRKFLQKWRFAAANCCLAYFYQFWSSGVFLAEQRFRLTHYWPLLPEDVDTFVSVSPSVLTNSFVVVLGLICTFSTKIHISFLSGVMATWSRGVYTSVGVFVQINVVPPGIWKMFPQMNQTFWVLYLLMISNKEAVICLAQWLIGTTEHYVSLEGSS